ncbi:hypothetical protein [Bacillus sp. NPDC094106]|uniref:hypothetical protein n=1 Tax=Bacillus sp. NPDC094106 TaxID=3363949 RepID=UPI0037F1F133
MVHLAKTELRSYAKSFDSTVVPVYSINEIKKEKFNSIKEEANHNHKQAIQSMQGTMK